MIRHITMYPAKILAGIFAGFLSVFDLVDFITGVIKSDAFARCQANATEYTYQGNTYQGIIALATAKNIIIESA